MAAGPSDLGVILLGSLGCNPGSPLPAFPLLLGDPGGGTGRVAGTSLRGRDAAHPGGQQGAPTHRGAPPGSHWGHRTPLWFSPPSPQVLESSPQRILCFQVSLAAGPAQTLGVGPGKLTGLCQYAQSPRAPPNPGTRSRLACLPLLRVQARPTSVPPACLPTWSPQSRAMPGGGSAPGRSCSQAVPEPCLDLPAPGLAMGQPGLLPS